MQQKWFNGGRIEAIHVGFGERFYFITKEEIKVFEGREYYLNMFENKMLFGKKMDGRVL